MPMAPVTAPTPAARAEIAAAARCPWCSSRTSNFLTAGLAVTICNGVRIRLLGRLVELLAGHRERWRDVLEITPRRFHAHRRLDDPADDHHRGSDDVADEDLRRLATL